MHLELHHYGALYTVVTKVGKFCFPNAWISFVKIRITKLASLYRTKKQCR
jgi:hypothetical protein